MATKTYAGQTVEVNDEGYMVDASQWNKEIAAEIAKEEGIDLTDQHYEVLELPSAGLVNRGLLISRACISYSPVAP